MEKWRDVAINIIDIYNYNPVAWDFIIVISVFALALKVLTRPRIGDWIPMRPRGRIKMLRRARRNYVRSLTIDAMIHFVEEQIYNGEFTRAEAKELYRDARKYWPVKDLFPSPELLKASIQKRLNSKTHAPVALVGTEGKKRKHAFDKSA